MATVQVDTQIAGGRRRGFSLIAPVVMSLLVALLLAMPWPSIAWGAEPVGSDEVVSSSADALTVPVEAAGLTFTVPADARHYVTSSVSDTRELWRVASPLGEGELVVVADRRAWSGDEADIEAYVERAISAATDNTMTRSGVEWVTSQAGVRSCASAVSRDDSMSLVLATPLPYGKAALVGISFTSADDASYVWAVDATRTLMDSVRVAPLRYWEACDLINLPSADTAAALDADEALTCFGDVFAGGRGWTTDVVDPALPEELAGARGCAIHLYSGEDPADDGNEVGRAEAQQGVALDGILITWHNVVVPWDEASDVADALAPVCGLTDTLDDGYMYGWDEDGSYSWVRVGRCQAGGQDGYWMVMVQNNVAGSSSVTLGVNKLGDYFGAAGFASYDDLVAELLG